jgi:hypothetical protein
MNDIPAEYLERLKPRRRRLLSRILFDSYGLRFWAFCVLTILGTAMAVAVGIGGVVGGTAFLDQRSCVSEAHGLGLAHKWGPLEGCLLRTPGGQYIPDSQYFINHPQP